MKRPIQETERILKFALIVTAVLGATLLIIGSFAIYRGVLGELEFTFFGQSLKATNLGLACLFLGATLVIILIRRVLSSLDKSIVANRTNSINDTVSSAQKKKEKSHWNHIALPFFHMEPKNDVMLKSMLSHGSEEQKSQLQNIIINGPRYDVAIDTALKLEKLPCSEVPEQTLFPVIEQMFRRPAFYQHKERDWAYGLYAVVATRIVWEQEVIPRLRIVRRKTAAKISTKLLDIEDLHAKVLGLSHEELTRCTSDHLWHKKIFDYFLPRKPYNYKTIIEDNKRRGELVEELAELTLQMGLDLPELGSYNNMGQPGEE